MNFIYKTLVILCCCSSLFAYSAALKDCKAGDPLTEEEILSISSELSSYNNLYFTVTPYRVLIINSPSFSIGEKFFTDPTGPGFNIMNLRKKFPEKIKEIVVIDLPFHFELIQAEDKKKAALQYQLYGLNIWEGDTRFHRFLETDLVGPSWKSMPLPKL